MMYPVHHVMDPPIHHMMDLHYIIYTMITQKVDMWLEGRTLAFSK